jgi:ABC-type branched-subunit amino acid transport system permease subunit
VVGAFLFVWIEEVSANWSVGRYATFGLLLILTVYFFPRGIAGGFALLWDLRDRLPSFGRVLRPWK